MSGGQEIFAFDPWPAQLERLKEELKVPPPAPAPHPTANSGREDGGGGAASKSDGYRVRLPPHFRARFRPKFYPQPEHKTDLVTSTRSPAWL